MVGIYGPLDAAQAAYVIDKTRAVDNFFWTQARIRIGLGWDSLLRIAECLETNKGDEGKLQEWFAAYLHAPNGDVRVDLFPFIRAYRVAHDEASRFPAKTQTRIATLLKYIACDTNLDSPALVSASDPRTHSAVVTSFMVDLVGFCRWSGRQASVTGLDSAVLCTSYDKEVVQEGSYPGDSHTMQFSHQVDVARLERTTQMCESRREESFFITPLDRSLQGLIAHIYHHALRTAKEETDEPLLPPLPIIRLV